MDKRTLSILGGVIILVIILLVVGNRKTQPTIVSETEAQVPCLPNGHQQVVSHIHPTVSLVVDGEQEVLPANIGITPICMREIHTHDTTGKIHVETAQPGVVYTLDDFFAVWGQDIHREGYSMTITQDSEVRESAEDVILVDYSEIIIEYSKSLQEVH